MSRMQKVPVPYALPGSCFICGVATREFFIDTGRSLDFHGAVYFCSECLQEMAHMADYLSPEAATKLKFQVELLEKQVYELTKKEQGLEVAIGGLVAAGLSVPSDVDSASSTNLANQISEPATSGTENSLGTGTGEAVKPEYDKRVEQLSPDAERDATEFDFEFGN